MTPEREVLLFTRVEKIHTLLTGENGGGLVKDVKDIEDELGEMRKTMVTRDTCAATHKALAERPRRVFGVVKDIVILGGVVGTILWRIL